MSLFFMINIITIRGVAWVVVGGHIFSGNKTISALVKELKVTVTTEFLDLFCYSLEKKFSTDCVFTVFT